jgi:hypothetical protein
MSRRGGQLTNHNSQSPPAAKSGIRSQYYSLSPSQPPIFILCDTCRWCATYFDKTTIPKGNRCPQCNDNNNELSSFPIMSNESFTFGYSDEHGIELEFKPRRKGN